MVILLPTKTPNRYILQLKPALLFCQMERFLKHFRRNGVHFQCQQPRSHSTPKIENMILGQTQKCFIFNDQTCVNTFFDIRDEKNG